MKLADYARLMAILLLVIASESCVKKGSTIRTEDGKAKGMTVMDKAHQADAPELEIADVSVPVDALEFGDADFEGFSSPPSMPDPRIFKKASKRPIKQQHGEQEGANQSATRPVVEPEGGDKPQPEAEGSSR